MTDHAKPAGGAVGEESMPDLRSFVHMLPFGVIHFDDDGRVRIVNPAAINLLAPTIGIGDVVNLFDEFAAVWPEFRLEHDRSRGLGPTIENHRLSGVRDGLDWWLSVGVVRVAAGESVMTVIDASALVRAEEATVTALGAAEARQELLTGLIDSSPVGIGLFDANFRCIQINSALADINGVSISETLGRTPDAYLPDLWPSVEPHFRAGLNAPLYDIELEGETPARPGERRWWLANYFPVELGSDTRGVAAMVVEITDRKRFESLLAQSESRFRELSDSSPLVVWEHDADGKQLWVNQTYCDYFGVSRDEILGDGWQVVVHPEDSAGYVEAFERAVVECLPFHQSVRVRRADGAWRWLESWGNPRFDDDGIYVGHVGTSADVTDRIEGQRRLAEAAAFTGRVLDSLFAFAGVLEVDGTVLYANRAPLEAAGLQTVDVVGRKFWDCYWWNYSATIAEELRLAAERAALGHVVRYDVEVQILDGAMLPIDFQIAPLLDDAGAVTHLVVSGLDLSERTELERITQQARWRAETLETAATRLAAAVTLADIGAIVVEAATEIGAAVLDSVQPFGLERVGLFGVDPAVFEGYETIPLEAELPANDAVRRNESIVLHTPVEILEAYPALSSVLAATAVASTVSVPCRTVDGDVLAVLTVAAPSEHWFDAERLALLEAFAAQAGGALERAALYEREQQARSRADRIAALLIVLEQADGIQRQLDAVIEYLLEDLADYATIEAPGHDPHLLAHGHIDPEQADVLATLRTAHRVPSESINSVGRAAAGRSQLISKLTEELRAEETTDPETAELLERLGPRSHMAVALDLGAGIQGVIMVGRSRADAMAYTEDDLAYLEQLAIRVGVILSAGRVRRVEHEASLRLQQALLPDTIRWDPRVPIAAVYRAAGELLEVGGDWYDTFSWPSGHIGAMVGDVVGHTIDSAAAMGRLRAATAAIATRCEPDPAAVLDGLDQFARGPDGVSFATAVCVVIDPLTGRLTYASAGHPPGIVVTPQQTSVRLDQALTPPLAVLDRSDRRSASFEMTPGSVVVLYSDGLVERRGERIHDGITRLESEVRSSIDLPVALLAEHLVSESTSEQAATDDIVVVCIRFAPVVAELRRSLPPDLGTLADLRSDLRTWCSDHDIDEDDERDILLVIGEAAANAVEHAYVNTDPDVVDLVVTHHGHHLAVEVTDRGRWRRPGPHSSIRGRGTSIMKALATRFERETTSEGTRVSLAVPLRHPRRPEA